MQNHFSEVSLAKKADHPLLTEESAAPLRFFTLGIGFHLRYTQSPLPPGPNFGLRLYIAQVASDAKLTEPFDLR